MFIRDFLPAWQPVALFFGVAVMATAHAAETSNCTFPMAPKNPDAAYQVTPNGTIVDPRHGIEWDRCSWGQTGKDCASGQPATYNWDQLRSSLEAVDTANRNRHKGYNDWRMPSLTELQTLVETCRLRPAINTQAFPSTPSVWYWAWTHGNSNASDAAGIYFYDGYSYAYGHRNNQGLGRIRLVRDRN